MIKIDRPDCPYPKALEDGNYKHKRNKDALINASSGKCMYCESKVTDVYFGDVEHIKPKQMEKFKHLEFEWSNLGFSCAVCNNNKQMKYKEDLPYVNPYEEDPEFFFIAAGNILFNRLGDERADITIKEIDLNRPPLLEHRLEEIKRLNNLIDRAYRTSNPTLRKMAIEEIEEEIAPDKEYSLFLRTHWLLHNDA